MASERISLEDVSTATAIRLYDDQYEACVDVNAAVDPRPCFSYLVQTQFGLAQLETTALYDDSCACRLAIPGRPGRRHDDSWLSKIDECETHVVESDPLPSLSDPNGRDPVTDLSLRLYSVGFGCRPWLATPCAVCGDLVDAGTASNHPDGPVHDRCHPSNFENATLGAFAGGERQ